MAILSKIRKLPIILIILIIGLPLLSFVVDPSAIKDFFNAKKVNAVGEVAGEPITREEFATALANYKKQTNGQVSDIQAAKSVWNSLVRQKVYRTQLEEAGITIGEVDIMNSLCDAQFVKTNPDYQTAGVFDKTKFKNFLANIKQNKPETWKLWQDYMSQVKTNLETSTYNNLVSAGLGASLKEGELNYIINNTKINGDIVYVPFTTITDSTVVVSNTDVKAYIDAHQDEFKVDASRDIEFVKFDVTPTAADEANLTTELTEIISDREEYSNAAKTNVTVKGLKSTTDYNTFFIDNKSDLPYNEGVQFKSQLPETISTQLFAGVKGDVFGPYKEKNYLKVSKIIDVVSMPDSVKARHILIPFIGSRSAKPETTKTDEQAKQTADSLMAVVKVNPSKFEDLAKDFSSDGSATKGGDLGWFPYNRMVPEFRDYCFTNKTGDIGIVKSIFGYHVIKIDNQKNYQNALKLATFGRLIEASKETENQVYENASVFEQDIASGKSFEEVAKVKELKVVPAVGITALAEDVPGLGKQRPIVNWAFEKDVNVGSYKRFETETGYVIAKITDKTPKGLMPANKAMTRVRPILMNEKKAKLIEAQMIGATLEEIANATKQTVKKVEGITLQTPTVSTVGYEPNVVGAMVNAKENTVYKNIVGNKGVFALKVINREVPKALPNYDTERKRIANQRKNKSYQIFEALKKAEGVVDNLSAFYGVQQ